jgi:hypothetical protein
MPFAAHGLERFVISAECVVEMHVTVETYGIDEAFVFPDVGGLARYLNRQWDASR